LQLNHGKEKIMNLFKRSILLLSFTCILTLSATAQGIKYTKNDTIKYIIKNEILRFISGTFWSGVEIPLKNKHSLYLAGNVTYGSPFNNSKEFIGFGGEVQYRNYLGKGDFFAEKPIYLAGQLMFRRMAEYHLVNTPIYDYSGPYPKQIDNITTEEQKQYSVFYGGMLLGMQVFINQIFTIDINVGGGLRLVKIDGEKSFSKYKEFTALDYSGVVPRAGIIIGIIQH
jgi:hypothetical protein